MDVSNHVWLSIVRALIKSIPLAGAGLEELMFGTQASIDDEHLKRLVQTIADAVENDGLTEQNAQEFVNSEPIKALMESLKSRGDKLRREADNLLIAIGRETGAIEKIQSDLNDNQEAIQARFDSLEMIVRNSQNALNAAFTSLPEQIRKRSANDRIPLNTVRRWLRELNTSDLSACGHAVAESSLELPENSIVTIDFCEIYEYANSPYTNDRLSSFTVFVLTHSDLDLRLLPPSNKQLLGYFRNELGEYRNNSGLAESIHSHLGEGISSLSL